MQHLRAVLLAAALAGPPASLGVADNLIVNGNFHDDINGWTLIGVGAQAWDPLDWAGNPSSGSIRITNNRALPNQLTASGQCIPLTPSGTYEAGVHVWFPSGQTALGAGAVGMWWYDNPTCTDPPLSTANSPLVLSDIPEIWVETFMAGFTAPAGTVAVGVGPGVIKVPAAGSLQAVFDRVRFGPSGTTPVLAQSFSVE